MFCAHVPAPWVLENSLSLSVPVLPGVTFSEARQADLACRGIAPMPREMAFPVPKGGKWHDLYDYIRYGCSRLCWNPARLRDLLVLWGKAGRG